MDKNAIRTLLNKTFVTEGEPAIALKNKIDGQNKKINKDGVKQAAADSEKFDKSGKKNDADGDKLPQNKINYKSDEEKDYHDEMEIMNGQEMIQYDSEPDDVFKKRAEEAIEGSTRMGNNPEWANVVAKGWGADPDFGKNLVKKIKASTKNRNKETPTSKMFGKDWEVVPDEGHKSYAVESENKNKPQITEKMKRITFKKEFNGIANALKLIPENYKVDNKEFLMTDGNETYKIRWEGTVTEGKAAILLASDKKTVNEDILKMKHLFNYKSENTLGLHKPKDRLDESKSFNTMLGKMRKIQETEEIEGQKAKEGEWDDAVKHSADAKKHIEGSVSTEESGMEAPAPKIGEWDKINISQSSDAKKHIQGSTSDDKGTQAPKPKEGPWELIKIKHAPEAKDPMKSAKGSKQETNAPAPKTGNPDKAVKQAPEAKENIKKK